MLKHYSLERSSPISKSQGAQFEKSKENFSITATKESQNIGQKSLEIHSLKRLLSSSNMFNISEMMTKWCSSLMKLGLVTLTFTNKIVLGSK